MKILTFNFKKGYQVGKTIIKILSLILIAIIIGKITSGIYLDSQAYSEALSDATDTSVIIIDAGHGGEDCGAIGVNGVYEKDLNLAISTELGKMFSEKGYAVVYTRTTDTLLYTEKENIYGIRKISDLKNRCKIGAEYPNAIYVSVHMNSYKNSKYSGLQVYYSENNDSSYALASSIQRGVKSTLQKDNNRQIKPGKDMYILENLQNPAVLIECGFLTNSLECEKLTEKEYQKELSFAIFCGIIEYINKGK